MVIISACAFVLYQVEGIVALVRGEEEGGLSLIGFGIDSLVEVASGLLVLRHLLVVPPDAANAAAANSAAGKTILSRDGSSRTCGGFQCMHGLLACFESFAKHTLPAHRNRVATAAAAASPGTSSAKLFSPLDAYAAERAVTLIIGGLLGLLGMTAAIGASINLATGTGPHAALSALVVSSASLSFMGALWAFKVQITANIWYIKITANRRYDKITANHFGVCEAFVVL